MPKEQRRKYFRAPIILDIVYRLSSSEQEWKKAKTSDVSGGGLKASFPSPYSRGTILNLRIVLPDGSNPIFATGEVAWARKVETKGKVKFETGIRFKDINLSDRSRIIRFVYQNLGKSLGI